MKKSIKILVVLTTILSACNKSDFQLPISSNFPKGKGLSNGTMAKPQRILIDGSHDGGVWWFPQSIQTCFSPTNEHQGKKLVEYLVSQGFFVDELPRGEKITSDLLNQYSKVIRAGAFGNYSQEEMAAYESFLNRNTSLLLLSDHLTNTTNDNLSSQLGLQFEGAYGGTITSFTTHPVTDGVTSYPFNVGSVVRNFDPSKIKIVGSIQVNGSMAGAMGTVDHPNSKIFFIGDTNGIETIPQPFTVNLINWLFR